MAGKRKQDLWQDLFDPSFFVPALVLLVVFCVSIWVVIRLRARYRSDADPDANVHQMLTQFGDLRREGGLTDEEYRSIKGRLIEQLDGSARPMDASGDS